MNYFIYTSQWFHCFFSKVSDWPFCNASVSCLSQSNQPEIGKFLDLTLGIKSEADDLEEEVDSDICVDSDDDPNEKDEDCPIVYKLGGNSKMALNKGVSRREVSLHVHEKRIYILPTC